ncbi:hypothetical protein LC653_30180 [Nostoc sp. CHAB 5784]|nr:hypothetical protein [Nostoc mirabile CHAB5784]
MSNDAKNVAVPRSVVFARFSESWDAENQLLLASRSLGQQQFPPRHVADVTRSVHFLMNFLVSRRGDKVELLDV